MLRHRDILAVCLSFACWAPVLRAADIRRDAPSAPEDDRPIEWVRWIRIPGGSFKMGTPDFRDTLPVHEVAVRTFWLAQTHATVRQYADCVAAGRCTEPDRGEGCNWDRPGREDHPVNCVDWRQAGQFAGFMGARLPSEAEWEYAAKGGEDRRYPWGTQVPDCGNKLALLYGAGGPGCGGGTTQPVCGARGYGRGGVCDMSGNVQQWIEDEYRSSYAGAPADGRPAAGPGPRRAVRGGAYTSGEALMLRSDYRGGWVDEDSRCGNIGLRLARSTEPTRLYLVGRGKRRLLFVSDTRGWFFFKEGRPVRCSFSGNILRASARESEDVRRRLEKSPTLREFLDGLRKEGHRTEPAE